MKKNTRSSNSISNRSSSDTAIRLTTGWYIFILGIIIATFVGGAVRAFLSPAQLTAWVEKKMAERQPPFSLKFDKIEFKLADGFRPRFGFGLSGFKIKSNDPCVARIELGVDNIYIHIKLSSLFSDKIRFGEIEAGVVELNYQEPLCNTGSLVLQDQWAPPTPVKIEASNTATKKTSQFENVKSFFVDRFDQELINSQGWFESLQFDHLNVREGDNPVPRLRLESFVLDLTRDEKKIFIGVNVDVLPESQEINVNPIYLKLLVGSQSADLYAEGRFKEGELIVNGTIDVVKDHLELTSRLSYLPVGELRRLLNSKREVALTDLPRLLWLNCEIEVDGRVSDLSRLKAVGSNCGLHGEKGRVSAEKFVITQMDPISIEPFKMEFHSFPVRFIVESFEVNPLVSVFTNMGEVTGFLVMSQIHKWDFEGHVQGTEVVFSRQGRKRLQLIPKLKLQLGFDGERVSALIPHIEIQGGEFNGQMSVNFDKNLREGFFQVQVDAIRLAPLVSDLYFGSEVAPLQIFGKGRIANQTLLDWQGTFGAAYWGLNDWRVEKIKIETDFFQGKGTARVQAEHASVSGGSWVNLMNEVLQLEPPEESFRLSRLKFLVREWPDELSWNDLMATIEGREAIISSAGHVKQEGQLSGWVSVDKKTKKLNSWNLSGSLSGPEVQPGIQ